MLFELISDAQTVRSGMLYGWKDDIYYVALQYSKRLQRYYPTHYEIIIIATC